MDGTFAGPALLHTSRVVLAKGSPTQQAAFKQIATSSAAGSCSLTTHARLEACCASYSAAALGAKQWQCVARRQ